MLDLTKSYRTRDGREAQAIAAPDGRFYGWIKLGDSIEGLDAGRLLAGSRGSVLRDKGAGLDLVNVPETRTVKGWFNVWPTHIGHSHLYRAVADRLATPDRIACIEREITYTVGEGLEP